jgi:hypothetical protein
MEVKEDLNDKVAMAFYKISNSGRPKGSLLFETEEIKALEDCPSLF